MQCTPIAASLRLLPKAHLAINLIEDGNLNACYIVGAALYSNGGRHGSLEHLRLDLACRILRLCEGEEGSAARLGHLRLGGGDALRNVAEPGLAKQSAT